MQHMAPDEGLYLRRCSSENYRRFQHYHVRLPAKRAWGEVLERFLRSNGAPPPVRTTPLPPSIYFSFLPDAPVVQVCLRIESCCVCCTFRRPPPTTRQHDWAQSLVYTRIYTCIHVYIYVGAVIHVACAHFPSAAALMAFSCCRAPTRRGPST